MESKAKLLGHPIHPVLVTFPIALFTSAVLFDVLYLWTGADELARFAFWAIAIGAVVGLAAALFGLIDWMGIRPGSRAKRVGAWHGIGNVVVVLVFGVSWGTRLGNVEYEGVLPFLVALAGIGLVLVTAWLGGELVYRLRIGVDEMAHDDAPSSLGAEPMTSPGGAESPEDAAARRAGGTRRPTRVT